MPSYYRLMLGSASVHARDCFDNGYVGCNFSIDQDLSEHLPDDWRKFNAEFRPIRLQKHPEKSKIAAGLSCGFLWTVSKGMKTGDVVLCPDGLGSYHLGEIQGGYYYVPNTALPHRRQVRWLNIVINKSEISDSLKNSLGSIGTVSEVTQYAGEIERFIGGCTQPQIVAINSEIEDPVSFALEKHLEDFLVANRTQTDLGKDYDIFRDEDAVGQQYPTDTGPIDILAISKDKSELLVVELKKGKASDVVVGQIQRYMGYVKEDLAEPGQTVKGIIIGLTDDVRIRRALAVTNNIKFMRYELKFKLLNG